MQIYSVTWMREPPSYYSFTLAILRSTPFSLHLSTSFVIMYTDFEQLWFPAENGFNAIFGERCCHCIYLSNKHYQGTIKLAAALTCGQSYIYCWDIKEHILFFSIYISESEIVTQFSLTEKYKICFKHAIIEIFSWVKSICKIWSGKFFYLLSGLTSL